MAGARPVLRRAVPGYLAILVCLAAAAWVVAGRTEEIDRALDAVSVVDVVVSTAFGAVAVLALFRSWNAVMVGSGARLTGAEALTVYATSQLGKYLPGAVWPVVGQARMGRRKGLSALQVASASVLALALSVAAALALGCLFLPLAGRDAAARFWWAPLLALPLLVGLCPPVLNPFIARLGRLARRPMVGTEIGWSATVKAVGWCWLGNLAFGAHLQALGHGVGLDGVRGLVLSVAGYSLASGLGVLVVFLPAGVGVREVAIVVVLGLALSAPAALTVALLSRVILVVVDVALGLSRTALLHTLGSEDDRGHVAR